MKNLFASSVSKVLVGSLLIAGLASGLNIVSASNSSNGLLDSISDPVSPSPTPISNPVGSTVKVYAYGTEAFGVYPILILAKDGKYVTQWNNVSNDPVKGWKELTYNFPYKVSANQISVGFANDAYDPNTKKDRNVAIDKINVDGVDYQSEAPNTFSVGSIGSNGIVCSKGFVKSEWLFCNGYFAYDVKFPISAPVR